MKNKLNMREILNIAAKVIPWCYTNTQNLGQRYPGTGTRKYKSTNEKGEPTGVGYAFEDRTKIRWEEQGYKVEQVPTMKNGADFILDGELCQLKCGANPGLTGEGFYQKPYGPYRYEGQTAVVPKGHKEGAEYAFHSRDKNGLGRPKKVIESPITREEAVAYGTRGKASLKMDLSDRQLRNSSLGFGAMVAVVGGGIELGLKWKKLDTKGKVLTGLKWLGIGAASSIAAFGTECGRRQFLRP